MMKQKCIALVAFIMATSQQAYSQDTMLDRGSEPHEVSTSPLAYCFMDAQTEARCWHEIGAQSIPTTWYDFGVHYANGDGAKQDLTQGRYWIHKAALGGYPLAQYNLGVMFFDGIGGIQNQQCAIHWLDKAALDEGDAGLMAKQARQAISEFSTHSTVRVYRPMSEQECEQLPANHFFVKKEKLVVEDARLIADGEAKQEEGASFPIFRERMGRYFVSLGYALLGQADEQIPYVENRHDIKPEVYNETLLAPETAREEASLVVVENTPDKSRDLDDDNASQAVQNSESEGPLFVARVLEHSARTPDDNSELMATPSMTDGNIGVASPVATEDVWLKRDTYPSEVVDALPLVSEEISAEPKPVVKKTLNPLNLGGALKHAPKNHYTLQLSSASQAEPLLALAKKQKLSNYLVYETQRHGRRWYVLVYGEYAGMTQAKQALQQLPSALKKDTPWIRSLAHVQTEL